MTSLIITSGLFCFGVSAFNSERTLNCVFISSRSSAVLQEYDFLVFCFFDPIDPVVLGLMVLVRVSIMLSPVWCWLVCGPFCETGYWPFRECCRVCFMGRCRFQLFDTFQLCCEAGTGFLRQVGGVFLDSFKFGRHNLERLCDGLKLRLNVGWLLLRCRFESFLEICR